MTIPISSTGSVRAAIIISRVHTTSDIASIFGPFNIALTADSFSNFRYVVASRTFQFVDAVLSFAEFCECV